MSLPMLCARIYRKKVPEKYIRKEITTQKSKVE
jgi:hypothetical protein